MKWNQYFSQTQVNMLEKHFNKIEQNAINLKSRTDFNLELMDKNIEENKLQLSAKVNELEAQIQNMKKYAMIIGIIQLICWGLYEVYK
jgi:ATP-dependent 26S proteasome regulatory subunit